MKKIAKIIEKSTNKVVADLYSNNVILSGLFDNINYDMKQLTGTCQCQFSGKKAQARHFLKKFFNYDWNLYKISFIDSDLKN